MTQEEKELLIKDLCARLPYSGVQIHISYADGFKYDKTLTYEDVKNYSQLPACSTTIVKPYLRPMSSMTEEEFTKLKEYSGLIYNHQLHLASFQNGAYKCLDFYLNEAPSGAVIRVFDWLNRKMFDYRGLIEKGLALEAKEGMYEHEPKSDVNESGSRIKVGCKIRSKTNPNEILTIISDDCHGDEFECANGDVLSLKQIEKYYDIIT